MEIKREFQFIKYIFTYRACSIRVVKRGRSSEIQTMRHRSLVGRRGEREVRVGGTLLLLAMMMVERGRRSEWVGLRRRRVRGSEGSRHTRRSWGGVGRVSETAVSVNGGASRGIHRGRKHALGDKTSITLIFNRRVRVRERERSVR